MKIYGKNSARSLIRRLFATVAAAILCMSLLVGCGGLSVRVVAPPNIEMFVGEVRNLMPYVDGADGDVAFSSSDDGVVRISGSYATAVMPGEATVNIRAKGVDENISVSVKYREASTVEINYDGDIVQNIDDISDVTPIAFYARTDDFVDPQENITWYVDGKSVSLGKEYSFFPTRFGEYVISARLQGLSRDVSVKIFRATEAYGRYVGKLEQMHDYSTVMFSAYEEIDTRNPTSVVSWTVDGVEASRDRVFELTPTAQGEYSVELYVNGVKRQIDGKDSVTVNAAGDRAPSANIRFDSDGVFIEWGDGGNVRSVVITDPLGIRTSYSSTDISCAYRFGDGVFDATELIDITSNLPGEYSIFVSAVGQGETLTFTQYGADAKEYIDSKLFIGNYFIDSVARSEAFVTEMYVTGIDSAKAYVARDVNAEQVALSMHNRAKELNLTASVTVDGSIVTVVLDEYTNAPTKNGEQISEQRMYSLLPHIEYNESNRRASNFALAIDRTDRTIEVNGTEQLLLAVLSGYKPAATGSAKRVYDNARRALLAIVGKNYSDFDKVHAIYDWLQWTEFRTIVGTSDAEYSSNYLESMFDGDGRPPCTVTSLGAAKAFALLASMEGIATEIVPIDDGEELYYIDRVKIGGVYYIVDVYGGEYEMSSSREISTHERLLINDDIAALFGICGDDEHNAFDIGHMYYLKKYTYGDEYYDYYISAEEAEDELSLKAALFGAFDRFERTDVRIFTITGTDIPSVNTAGAEFYIDDALSSAAVDKLKSALYALADEYAEQHFGEAFRDGAVNVYSVGRTMHITAIMPLTAKPADIIAAANAENTYQGVIC